MRSSHLNNITKLESVRCTGCGVCQDSCPTGAIGFVVDSEGFRMPAVDDEKCVNCGLCVKKCPVLSLNKSNKIKPDMYAVRAADEIRAVSSSGGVFSLLAEYILRQGGSVCGAAFDENMQLKHVMISSAEELPALRGSKYLQSDTTGIYNKVKECLKKNKPVLFVGTPCQVAAINNYIGDDKNLFTADILCHGVPSQQSFDKYIREVAGNKNIKRVDFRNKRHGWNAEHIIVEFDDGTEYDKSMKEGNPYVKAFLSNMMLRKSCEDCQFCDFPRHGNLSIGDFWGISKFDKTQNDGKGTSIVFVNDNKGEKFFSDSIKGRASTRKFAFSTQMPNRIHAYFRANEKRERFLNLLNKYRFSKAMEYVLQGKYDVGLVSNYNAVNFGGSLTQFALYKVLEDLGYSTLMIDRPANAADAIPPNARTICYNKYPYPEYALSQQYPTKDDMRALNRQCDSFVVGSDQLFQNTLFNILGGIYTLDWVSNTKRKIAYAASFGFDYVWGDQKQIDEMGYFMQQFDAFSVREESGVDVAKNYFGVNAVHVLDPVFLCDTKYYDELIANSPRKITDKYISSYILDPSPERLEILRMAKKKLGVRVEVFSELGNRNKEVFSEFDYQMLKVDGRLQSIKNADFFVCDSFHGTCLAILYNVPFISVVNKQRGGARFGSLLRYFGLENRMVETVDEVRQRPELFDRVDFSYANEKLREGREFGLKWLQDALQKEPRVGASLYDILVNRLQERDKEIALLRRLVKNLYKDKNVLAFTDSIDGYIDALKKNQRNSLYLIAVKDTPGLSVTEEMATRLRDALGIKTDMAQKHWKSFIAIVDAGKVVYEQLSDKKLEKEVEVGEFNIKITSAALNVGNVAKIQVNGIEYAMNKRGFNIVAIDKEEGRVCDSAYLDMHLRTYAFGHSENI